MSLALLLPLGLAALASLIVPLLIHLIRRPEQEIIDFAALRWLRQSLRPRRRLNLDDLWLLLTRLVLLCLLALLLAVPVLKGEWRGPRHVIAVSADADLAAARTRILNNNADWVWLMPGFPSIDRSIQRSGQPQASLLRELDASLSREDQLTVVVADQFAGLDAQRITLGHPAEWIEVAAASTPSATELPPMAHVLAIRSDATVASTGLSYIRAAASVWKTPEGNKWQIDDRPAVAPLPTKLDALIWMDGAVPQSVLEWVKNGGRALVVDDPLGHGSPLWRDQQGDTIASDEAVGAGHVIHLRGPLTPAHLPDLLDADFPYHLQRLLLPPRKPSDRAHSREVRPAQIDRPDAEKVSPLDRLLGLLIAVIFLIERVLATRRRMA